MTSFLKKIQVEAGDVWVLLELNSKSDPRVSVYRSKREGDTALAQRKSNQKEQDSSNRSDTRFYLLRSSLS